MRKIRLIVAAVAVLMVVMSVPAPAGAMTCTIPADRTGTVCKVVLAVVGPVCSKHPCG